MDSSRKALELDEIGELIEFARSELADRELSNLDDYVGAARRAVEIAERLPALLGEREAIKAPEPSVAAIEMATKGAFVVMTPVLLNRSKRALEAAYAIDVAPLIAERDALKEEVARLSKQRDDAIDRADEAADIVRERDDRLSLCDRIANLIGLPHDQELTQVAFELWFGESRADSARLRQQLAAMREAGRPFAACVFNDNGDVTVRTGGLRVDDWIALRAALAQIDAPAVERVFAPGLTAEITSESGKQWRIEARFADGRAFTLQPVGEVTAREAENICWLIAAAFKAKALDASASHARPVTDEEVEQATLRSIGLDPTRHESSYTLGDRQKAMMRGALQAFVGGRRAGIEEAAEGEVRVVVSGLTGSGKSAIAGEIEIALRAIGVPVEWPDGAGEKNMTHADWQTALELYKPRVVIVERNIPRKAK
jgi:hypothetical protein